MTVIRDGGDGKYAVAENFPTHEGARTIAVNKRTHHVYLTAADFLPAEEGQKPGIKPDSFFILDIAAY